MLYVIFYVFIDSIVHTYSISLLFFQQRKRTALCIWKTSFSEISQKLLWVEIQETMVVWDGKTIQSSNLVFTRNCHALSQLADKIFHVTSSDINLSSFPRFAEDVVFTIINRCTAESCHYISLAKEGKTKDYQFPVSRTPCQIYFSEHETVAWIWGWQCD